MGLWLGQWLLGPQMDKKWMGKITQVLNLILERSVALVGWFLRNIVWLNAPKGFFLSWLWKAATAGILPVSWHTLSLRCSCLSGPILTLSRNKVIRLPHNQQALRINNHCVWDSRWGGRPQPRMDIKGQVGPSQVAGIIIELVVTWLLVQACRCAI